MDIITLKYLLFGMVYFESTVIVFCEVISVTIKIEDYFIPFYPLFFKFSFLFSCLSLHKQGSLGLVSTTYFS